MEKLKLRLFWASFYGILWQILGRNVTLTILVSHAIVLPLLCIFSKRFWAYFVVFPIALPFLRHDDPKKFGLDGARNFYMKFDSKVANCTINLGVWHALPKSLVKKNRFLLNNGTKDELNRLFDEELKNSDYPVFLYIPGMTATRAAPIRVTAYNVLQNLDAHVVAFDYRAFGDSTNVTPKKIGLVEDSLIMYSWIRSLVGKEKPVFIWGHSLGSGIAQRAFSKLKIYSHDLLGLKEPLPPPQGIVVEGGYNSNSDLSKVFLTTKFITWIPGADEIISHNISASDCRIIPENYAHALRKYPMLLLHSKDDFLIPYRFGKTLYEKLLEARKEGDKEIIFITFENDGHINICSNPAIPSIVEDFIKHNK